MPEGKRQIVITTTVPETLYVDCCVIAAIGPDRFGGAFAALMNLIVNQAESQPGRPTIALGGSKSPGMDPDGGIYTNPRCLRLSLTLGQRRDYRAWAYAIHTAAGDPRLVRAARMVHDWLGWDVQWNVFDMHGRNEIRSAI